MIQMINIDDKFIESNRDFLEAVQEAIKVGVSINLPSGINNEPETVSRFNIIEQEVINRFDKVQTLINIPGLMLQFLFCSMECLVTCIVTQENGDKHFQLNFVKLKYKPTYFPK